MTKYKNNIVKNNRILVKITLHCNGVVNLLFTVLLYTKINFDLFTTKMVNEYSRFINVHIFVSSIVVFLNVH